MSKLIKLGLIVTILASLGSLFFAFRLGSQKKELLIARDDLTQKLSAETTEKTRVKGELQTKTDELATKVTELTDVSAKLSAKEVELGQKAEEAATLTARVAELEPQLEEARTKMAAAESDLQKIKDTLTKAGVEDISNIDALRQRITAQADENRLLGENLILMRASTARLKREIEEMKTTPAGLRGRVAVVESKWNFVVLDVGQQQRVQPKTEFVVYRDSKLIAKVQVVSVGQTTSIAEMLPEYGNAKPRPGDLAVH